MFQVGKDWAGHNLNKCARLCSEARPFGVVVDADDFSEVPKERPLVRQVRRLRGIGEVRVWVTPEIATQFIPRERLRETPEVHVAGMCLTEAGTDHGIRVLLARRAVDRQLFPGKIEGCGGQLRHSENFTDGVRRHFQSEFGIDVEVLYEHCFYFYEIRQPDTPVIPGIRFLCRRIGDNEPRSANHSEVWWASEEELRQLPGPAFVGDLKQETIQLLNEYRRRIAIGP